MSLTLFFYLLLSLVSLLPLKDEGEPAKRLPVMTLTLIAINTLVHIAFYYVVPAYLADKEAYASFQESLFLVPANVIKGTGLGAISIITAAFLHIDWFHLLSNMFFLFFFGRKVENLLGSWKFGMFYLACIFVSAAGSILGHIVLPVTKGMIPIVGASGAIMGVVAAYLFLYSEQRIRTLVVLAVIPIPFAIKMPAWVFIVYTITRDALGALLEQELQAQGYFLGMVDFFAHLAGVAAGLLGIYLFLPAEVLYHRHRLSTRRR